MVLLFFHAPLFVCIGFAVLAISLSVRLPVLPHFYQQFRNIAEGDTREENGPFFAAVGVIFILRPHRKYMVIDMQI